MSVIAALGRQRQEVFKFVASLGNIVSPCLKKQTTKSTNRAGEE
jgi:hypothetical protein